MRKILIALVLIIALVFCFNVVSNGLELGESFKIANYGDVGTASKQIDTLISQLINLNDTGFAAKKSEINSAITQYKTMKEQYESLINMINTTPDKAQEAMSLVETYDIDFLWTIIGSYATEEGINLKMDLMKSNFFDNLDEAGYTMCDLKFTVSGEYIAITEFIYDIEDDSRLGFEITNFEMSKGGDNLLATFSIVGIPVSNRNLSKIQTSIETTTSPLVDAAGNVIQQVGNSLSTGTAISNTTTTNSSTNTTTSASNTTSTSSTTGASVN